MTVVTLRYKSLNFQFVALLADGACAFLTTAMVSDLTPFDRGALIRVDRGLWVSGTITAPHFNVPLFKD